MDNNGITHELTKEDLKALFHILWWIVLIGGISYGAISYLIIMAKQMHGVL